VCSRGPGTRGEALPCSRKECKRASKWETSGKTKQACFLPRWFRAHHIGVVSAARRRPLGSEHPRGKLVPVHIEGRRRGAAAIRGSTSGSFSGEALMGRSEHSPRRLRTRLSRVRMCEHQFRSYPGDTVVRVTEGCTVRGAVGAEDDVAELAREGACRDCQPCVCHCPARGGGVVKRAGKNHLFIVASAPDDDDGGAWSG